MEIFRKISIEGKPYAVPAYTPLKEGGLGEGPRWGCIIIIRRKISMQNLPANYYDAAGISRKIVQGGGVLGKGPPLLGDGCRLFDNLVLLNYNPLFF